MCAIERVNQSAAILIMSETEAKRRDIPRDRWIYLHGCGDAEDVEVITLRKHLDRSEAMRSAYDEAFRSAKLDMVRDRDRFACRDLYSCFPIAVNAARRRRYVSGRRNRQSRGFGTFGIFQRVQRETYLYGTVRFLGELHTILPWNRNIIQNSFSTHCLFFIFVYWTQDASLGKKFEYCLSEKTCLDKNSRSI